MKEIGWHTIVEIEWHSIQEIAWHKVAEIRHAIHANSVDDNYFISSEALQPIDCKVSEEKL